MNAVIMHGAKNHAAMVAGTNSKIGNMTNVYTVTPKGGALCTAPKRRFFANPAIGTRIGALMTTSNAALTAFDTEPTYVGGA